jgi:hypothetical protein
MSPHRRATDARAPGLSAAEAVTLDPHRPARHTGGSVSARARHLGFLLILSFFGCRAAEEGRSPEGAVRALIQSVRSGDRAAVYQQLGPATRARIQDALSSGRRNGVSPLLRAEDLVTVGWVPPAWDPSAVREIRRDGNQADVEVSSVAGDHEIVHLVREERHWRIELPLR